MRRVARWLAYELLAAGFNLLTWSAPDEAEPTMRTLAGLPDQRRPAPPVNPGWARSEVRGDPVTVESALRSAGLCDLVSTDDRDLTPPVCVVRARPAEIAQALTAAGLLATQYGQENPNGF